MTPENYDEFINSHENVLIFYHALYAAEYCTPLMEEWDLAAAQLVADEVGFLRICKKLQK